MLLQRYKNTFKKNLEWTGNDPRTILRGDLRMYLRRLHNASEMGLQNTSGEGLKKSLRLGRAQIVSDEVASEKIRNSSWK